MGPSLGLLSPPPWRYSIATISKEDYVGRKRNTDPYNVNHYLPNQLVFWCDAMFDLSDWNDNPEALSLSKSLVRKKNILTSRRETGESETTSRKKRLKRTKKLLDVLRTLETSHNQETFIPPQPQVSPVENPMNQHSSGETAASASASATLTQCLNRKRWKNRMKNKRRNKNKFKFPEEPVPGLPATPLTRAGAEEPRDSQQVHTQTRGKRKRGNAPESPHQVDLPSPPINPLVPSQQEKYKLQRLKKILQRSVRGADAASEASEPEIKASRGDQKEQEEEGGMTRVEEAVIPEDRSAVLRSRMEQRLSSARFRYINQQLYTSHSEEARDLFRCDPEAFIIYHNGFSQQVQRWPVNPIAEIIKCIRNRPSALVVADFGCGDAMLARSVRNKVHSFDLVALNEHVTACDIAEVPLSDETVDVVVFCLSLMGTNFTEFLLEANRVLKMGGVLLVAEVSSRFEDVRSFLSAMAQLGFKNVAKNTEHTYFFLFEFTKSGLPRSSVKHPGLVLKPCLYKKR